MRRLWNQHLTVFVITICTLYATSYSQDPYLWKLKNSPRITTGYFNNDGFLDTIVCEYNEKLKLVPIGIKWGTQAGRTDLTSVKSSGEKGSTKKVTELEELLAQFTLFDYPDQDVDCHLSVRKYDNDTLDDILMYFTVNPSTSKAYPFSFRAIAIFGQDEIREVNKINISEISTVQNTPFQAIQLQPNKQLIDGKVRDRDNGVSYVVPKYIRKKNSVTSNESQELLNTNVTFKVYPNPASDDVYIDIDNMYDNQISVVCYSVEGKKLLQQSIISSNTKTHKEKIQASSFASGCYFVQCLVNNHVVKTIPLIIYR